MNDTSIYQTSQSSCYWLSRKKSSCYRQMEKLILLFVSSILVINTINRILDINLKNGKKK